MLKQKFDDMGLEHTVGFFCRALSGFERNYAAYEVELNAVALAVEHFRMFLLGKEFLLRTDNAALRNLLRRNFPPTNRVERWILRLSEYSFKIEYQKAKTMSSQTSSFVCPSPAQRVSKSRPLSINSLIPSIP